MDNTVCVIMDSEPVILLLPEIKLNGESFLSMQVELHCGVRRFGHAAAAVKSGSTVHIVEFGGKDPHDSAMAATTFLQMSKCMTDWI